MAEQQQEPKQGKWQRLLGEELGEELGQILKTYTTSGPNKLLGAAFVAVEKDGECPSARIF